MGPIPPEGVKEPLEAKDLTQGRKSLWSQSKQRGSGRGPLRLGVSARDHMGLGVGAQERGRRRAGVTRGNGLEAWDWRLGIRDLGFWDAVPEGIAAPPVFPNKAGMYEKTKE